jgi:hypothetical protein
MDVFGHQQHRALSARPLHQVHDLLDDPVLDVGDDARGVADNLDVLING